MISSRHIKRIKKELELFTKDKKPNIQLQKHIPDDFDKNHFKLIDYTSDIIIFEVYLMNTKSSNPANNLTVKFRYTHNYPFTAPTLTVNGEGYINTIGAMSDKLPEIGRDPHDCMCCSSFTCPNNWGPFLSIVALLSEVRHNFIDIRRINDRITARKFVEDVFGKGLVRLPIAEYI
jgi:hypothetical protein